MALKTKQISFDLEGQRYEIKFPTVGQFIDIENMQMGLTNGNYGELIKSGLKKSYYTVDLVDAISILYVLVPKLREDLNVRSYIDLDMFLAKKLVKVFKTDIKPWFDELLAELMIDDDIPEPEIPNVKQETKEGDINLH